MSWQFLVAISVCTGVASVLLQRSLLKDDKSDPVAYSIVFQIMVGVIILVYALIKGFVMPDIINNWFNYVLMIILYGLGNLCIFKSLQLIEASEFTILFASRTIWTIIAALLFLQEHITTKQIIGTVLILSSIVIVSAKAKKITLNKGTLYALIGAIFFGLAFANDAYILKQGVDLLSYSAVAFIIPPLFVWAINPSCTKKMKYIFERSMLQKMTLYAAVYAISATTVYAAYQIGNNAAQIAPLAQTQTILTVILAIIFLKERESIHLKLIGAVMSFVGILLI